MRLRCTSNDRNPYHVSGQENIWLSDWLSRYDLFRGVYRGGFHTHIKCKDDEPELPMAVGDYVKSKVLNDILQWPPYEYEKLEPEQN